MVAQNKCFFIAGLALLTVGCAHQGNGPQTEALTLENQLLKERVRRLEQRVTDMDTKISFLAKYKKRQTAPKKKAHKHSLRQPIDLDVTPNSLHQDLNQKDL